MKLPFVVPALAFLILVPITALIGGPRDDQWKRVETGTGFPEQLFPGNEVNSAISRIVVTKSDKGIAWGGAHWQYPEGIDKVTSSTGTPLAPRKSHFVRESTSAGQVLKPTSPTGGYKTRKSLIHR
ncbi:MAG: hypothetical protein KBA71_09650 [Opitutaceae bacterium]|nr:hypothetical protein [Opitutaceae bacterium]